MNTLKKYIAPLLIFLLLAQAACELSVPAFLGDLVNRGVQQGGLEDGIPEALSKRGMELLKCFLPAEEQARMDAIYNIIEPESSEAQRFAKVYPEARKRTICVLREDVTPENMALARKAYDLAAHTFVLYMRHAESTDELEEIAWLFSKEEVEWEPGEFGEYLRDPTPPESSFPEGVIGLIPGDALFTMPSSEAESEPQAFFAGRLPVAALTAGGMMNFEAKTFGSGESSAESAAGNMMDFEGKTFGEPEEEPEAQPTPAPDLSFSLKDGLSAQKLQQAYSLMSLLEKAPPESVEAAREQARKAGAAQNRWMGSILKKRFYDELGRNTGEIQAKCVGKVRGRMILVGLLGLAASLLTLLVGRLAGGARVFWLRLLIYAPVLGVGSVILALVNSVSGKWMALFLAMVGMAAVMAAVPFLARVPALQKGLDRLEQFLRKGRSWITFTAALAAPALLVLLELACWAVLGAHREAVECSLTPVGDKMAWFQYACLFLRAFVLAAGLFLLGPGRRLGKKPGKLS